MNIYYTTDEKYMKAVRKICWSEFSKAKLLLENILEDEPDYGKAHCQLACIYYYELREYEKAKKHFELAIAFAPDFPDTYMDYLNLLVNTEDYEAAEKLAKKALTVKGIDKTRVFCELGALYEKRREWDKALQNFREGYLHAMREYELETCEKNIERVKAKKKSMEKYQYLLS